MINWLSSWASQVVFAVIMGTIIEMLLPSGNNKKYIKTVIGVYILFTMISPIISKITGEDLKDLKIDYNEYFNNNTTYEALSKDLVSSTESNVENIYLNNLKQDMTNKIKEKGYKVISIETKIEIKDESNYGKIKEIILKIQKQNTQEETQEENRISINKIQIGNAQENNTVDTDTQIQEIKSSEIDNLKEYLSSVYDLSKNNIKINE